MPELDDVPLTELHQGDESRISRVKVRAEEKLIYLEQVGLVPEAWLKVVSRAPFDGPIGLRLEGREVVVGWELSQQLRVQRVESDGSSESA
jgi:DtxR family Mn-dependent transcriptional regulator